jgi:cobalamin biosynthesis protein CobD/CbiB
MANDTKHYPVATLHSFLEEVSQEFRRFRFQATVNLIGAIFLLIFFGRLSYILYETAPLRGSMQVPLILDVTLLIVAFAVVAWSLDVWRHQRRFITRWGERFQNLKTVEDQLFSDQQS